MAPNAKLETIVQIANPFDLPVYKLQGSSDEPSAVYYQSSSGQQELADEDENEPSVRITTRARITYELDRFAKNEMLIINNIDTETDPKMAAYILNAFQKHKFEFTLVQPGIEEENETWQKIDQFFQKDFSNIGMTAVVTLLPSPAAGTTSVSRVEEWDVLNYFMANQPATLQGRPKLFITETPEPTNVPEVTGLASDTMVIQTNKILHDAGLRPLDLLCFKLISMEGTRDLLDIVSELHYEASQVYPNTTPVKCVHTMNKELRLEKLPQENTVDEQKEEFTQRLLSNSNLFDIYKRLFRNIQTTANSSDDDGPRPSSSSQH